MSKIIPYFLILFMVFGFAGCKSIKSHDQLMASYTEDQLYAMAKDAMKRERYQLAANILETLDANYPFGKHAQASQLAIIIAYYRAGDKAAAVTSADRFIHLYPRSPRLDYVFYLKGLANFQQDRGILLKIMPIKLDPATRDPGSAMMAYADFNILVKRFPNSQYAPDARRRMIYLRNLFARHQLAVARYYLKRHAYVAAKNRASQVVEIYPQSPSVPEALAILVKANEGLGLRQDAKDARRVLQTNYPDSPAFKKLAVKGDELA